MRKASKLLYRFRGYILALFAVALVVCPAAPFPQDLSHISEFVPYIAALFLYACGIALRVRARQYIGQHTRGNTHEADELVTVGPYAYCRHPLYTSNTCIAVGAVFFHLGTSQLFVLFAPALMLFEFALARAEDRFLEEKFGDTWRAWAKKTPMSTANIEAFFCRNSGGSPKPATNKDFPETGCPKRTVFQAFKADASTWFWLVIVNLIIVLLKFHTV